MKLIVGLGNPGNKYNFTRHNTGFLTLDFYFKLHDLKWSDRSKLNALIGREGDTFFIKPQNFYNDTGRVVQDYLHFYKIPISSMLVICDDFNLPFGKMRYRESGSAGGNNGLKSIIEALGTEDFCRLRIGTGNTELRTKLGDIDFVLSRFTPEEKSALGDILHDAAEKIDDFIG
ncbi:aminoacyl-tRNA hydrolase [Candidatus Saccharibacteria bacterium]|nr:aminoacyl-tRNA hydrolase [Candidatus Saccharibacteria bacterium]